MQTLADLSIGSRAEIVSLQGPPALAQRFMELGVFEGETVEMLMVAPLGDPLEILCGNSRLSVRRHEAATILIRPIQE